MIIFLLGFLIHYHHFQAEANGALYLDRELQLVTGVCPLNFLSFTLPQAPSTNYTKNVTWYEYQTTVVNFTSTFEGNDFYVNDTYIDPEAIKTFDDGTIRKMNKISKQCNFLERDDFENGISSHYFEITDATTDLIGACVSQDNRYKSCAYVDSVVTVVHDQNFSESEVIAIILESVKLFMDLNIATPFYHTYLGPYSVTSKFNVVLNGVQPSIMSPSDIDVYEQSLYNLTNEILKDYNPPIVITEARVLDQKLNGLNLEVETEVLAYYNASLSLKKRISEAISDVSKESIFVTNLKNMGSDYFLGLIGVGNGALNETKKLTLDFGQNRSFYVPDMSLKDLAALEDSDERYKESTGIAMSLAVLFTFFGIIAIGAGYGRYINSKKH